MSVTVGLASFVFTRESYPGAALLIWLDGFEPPTPSSQARCSTGLSYSQKEAAGQGLEPRPPGSEPGVLPLDGSRRDARPRRAGPAAGVAADP